MKYCRLDYIWIDGVGNIRSKNRIIEISINTINLSNIPTWNYDGSSTGQATVDQSEIQLKPVRIFHNPLTPNSMIVLCETYTDVEFNIPALYNHRRAALDVFSKCEDDLCWFGLEQEYFVLDPCTNRPLYSNLVSDNNNYCGISAIHKVCRNIADAHLNTCLAAGIKICGTNAEVAKGQWEFQIGPISNIDAGDHVWVARYFLQMIAESYGLNISYKPKLLENVNGSGFHINFSTVKMRSNGGYSIILDAIEKLSHKHLEHMQVYGTNNQNRLTGTHETSDYDKFTHGVGDRTASIRIPQIVHKQQMGYIEDRRPGANCDPYLATSIIASTVCL